MQIIRARLADLAPDGPPRELRLTLTKGSLLELGEVMMPNLQVMPCFTYLDHLERKMHGFFDAQWFQRKLHQGALPCEGE